MQIFTDNILSFNEVEYGVSGELLANDNNASSFMNSQGNNNNNNNNNDGSNSSTCDEYGFEYVYSVFICDYTQLDMVNSSYTFETDLH